MRHTLNRLAQLAALGALIGGGAAGCGAGAVGEPSGDGSSIACADPEVLNYDSSSGNACGEMGTAADTGTSGSRQDAMMTGGCCKISGCSGTLESCEICCRTKSPNCSCAYGCG